MQKYKIIYQNGVIQYKNLISQAEFENTIKPLQKEAYLLELNKKDKEANQIKKYLSKIYGDFFTIKSPLFKSLDDGLLKLINHKEPIQLIKL